VIAFIACTRRALLLATLLQLECVSPRWRGPALHGRPVTGLVVFVVTRGSLMGRVDGVACLLAAPGMMGSALWLLAGV